MKPFQDKLRKILHYDWPIVLAILAIFLVTNRYIFGWDDQHLEIPLLKHLIDPTLYRGDYYVESLKENFTSFLYPLLSRLITVEMIPSVYLALYLVARFVFFYWVFKLWKFISGGDRGAAFFCTLTIFMIGRTEEFIYRTFSHQEFSYMFVFAGFYYFYRGRYLVAALIYGLAANFHALYALFPMLYMATFLLLFQKEKKLPLLFKTGLGFVLTAMPFIIWTFARAVTRLQGGAHAYDNWMELYLLACPQNFIFGTKPLGEVLVDAKTLLTGLQNYIFLVVLYFFHVVLNEDFRRDLRAHAVAVMVLLLTIVTFVFTYIVPSHFILDLNLVRNGQYILFLLAGYTVLFLWKQTSVPIWRALFLSILVAVSGGKETMDIAVILATGIVLLAGNAFAERERARAVKQWAWVAVFVVLAVLYCGFLWPTFILQKFKLIKLSWLGALWGALVVALVVVNKKPDLKARLGRIFVYIPFAVMLVSYCFLHYNFVQITTHGGGFWQLQRNWEEMQRYVKAHTPKDALIMAPNDMEMGGFRIHSDRRLLVDYRDCGIVGFDLGATVEWQKRMTDIDAFKVIIKEPFTNALVNGILKYKVDYIVFMRYAAPPDSELLTKLYENEAFALYKVNRNE